MEGAKHKVRITNSIITRQSLDGMQRNLAAMAEAQHRVTTGLRIEKPSDDPAAMVGVMGADRQLRALEQYGRNIDAAKSRLSVEESTIDGLSGLLERAREVRRRAQQPCRAREHRSPPPQSDNPDLDHLSFPPFVRRINRPCPQSATCRAVQLSLVAYLPCIFANSPFFITC